MLHSRLRAGFSTVVIAVGATPECWQVRNRKDYIDVMVYLVWAFIGWNWYILRIPKYPTADIPLA